MEPYIGEKAGKMMVFGGCYSNLQALMVLESIATEKQIAPENIIHTGDLIGYCASPRECIELVEAWGIHGIRGNVEENVLSGADDCGCNYVEGGRCEMFSRSWFPFVKTRITEKNRFFLAKLPKRLQFKYAEKQITVLHGSTDFISEFIFKSTPWLIKQQNFEQTGADVILAGHCGIPFADKRDGKIWLNGGVIGMPANDGTPFVWYLILDDTAGFSYSFHRFEYDNFEANQLMMEEDLPRVYAETLLTGLWDNTEILPPGETEEQGKELVHLLLE